MFDNPYHFQYLGKKDTLIKDPIKRINYRFKAKFRSYFVTLEVFSTGIVAIKYCDVKDIGAHNAYKKIFNDGDAFRVITTCLFIMLHYWQSTPITSFAFYAVPREWKAALLEEKTLTEEQLDHFITEYKKARFSIYNYAMLNLFPPKNFIPIRDTNNSIYILLNKRQPRPKATVKALGKYLLEHHNLIFEADEE